LSENTPPEVPAASTTVESSPAMDLILPLRVLLTPLRAFSQLAQRPAAKGLITLALLLLLTAAATQYASAAKIYLSINGQPPVSFLVSNDFANWFTVTLANTLLYVVMYWLVLVVGLALIGRSFGGKNVSLRNSFVILSYLLSVFIVLYAVRAAMYLALPSINFQTNSWPPAEQDVEAAVELMTQQWGPLWAYQFGSYFSLIAFAWFIILGVIAVKNMREVSWVKASIVSVIGYVLTFFLLGLP
jgi:hypothetical protein